MKHIIIVGMLMLALGLGFYSLQKEGNPRQNVAVSSMHTPRAQSLTDKIESGDIVFQITGSGQSKAIQLATHSKYSHVGIVFEEKEELWVYEAVQPVKVTPIGQWIQQGVKGHVVVKRLKAAQETLTPSVIENMISIGRKHLGKRYDLYFEWSDERIYCSELVWKIYKQATGLEIGTLQELSEFDLSHDLVKLKMKERYGDNIPMDEKIISPAAMFHSELLVTVAEN